MRPRRKAQPTTLSTVARRPLQHEQQQHSTSRTTSISFQQTAFSLIFFFITLSSFLIASVSADSSASSSSSTTSQQQQPPTLSSLLDTAKQFHVARKYSEALEAYESAINAYPTEVLPLYLRAMVNVQLGRGYQALLDLNKALDLHPEFDKALLERGKLFAKECDMEEAVRDLKKYLASGHESESEVTSLIPQYEQAALDITEADRAKKQGKWDVATNLYREVVKTCQYSVKMRLNLVDTLVQVGDAEAAIAGLNQVIKLEPSRLDAYLLLHSLHAQIGELDDALKHLKECLRSDPEHKECKKKHRELKDLLRRFKNADDSAKKGRWKDVKEILVDEKGLLQVATSTKSNQLRSRIYELACKAYHYTKDHPTAVKHCSSVLEIDNKNIEVLLMRADSHMASEDYDAALRDFSSAHELDPQNGRVHEGYQKAQRLKKMASRKDYYKILGIPRDADKRVIKRAYRALAHEWHPDKYRGDLPADKVAAKMSEINQAYEVLSNEELRAKFDNGEDPFDQTQGQGGHHHHGGGQHFFGGGFPGGGFPFHGHGGGGGGQQFKFRFN